MVTITHFLNGTQIDEPIGFDKFKTTIKRDKDYHGMSVEASVGELEFYGTAAEMIRTAYAESIDSELLYVVMFGNVEGYRGMLDLETYKEQCSEYCSVSCKVGEIGVKTEFIEKTETKVDLNESTDLSGEELQTRLTWQNVNITPKSILYTDRMEQEILEGDDDGYNGYGVVEENTFRAYLTILPTMLKLEEFGSLGGGENENGHIACVSSGDNVLGDVKGYCNPIFGKGSVEDWNENFGENSTYDIHIDLKISVKLENAPFFGTGSHNLNQCMNVTPILCHKNTQQGGYIHRFNNLTQQFTDNITSIKEFHIQGTFTDLTYEDLYLFLYIENDNYIVNIGHTDFINNEFGIKSRIEQGSYIELKLKSVKEGTFLPIDCVFVHNALNDVVQKVSNQQLTVKSDWYSSSRYSTLHKHTKHHFNDYDWDDCGGGAMKVLTNGYKMRASEFEKMFSLSFKDLITNLNAMDCIGWCFEKDENGEIFVRVERWDWFYKNYEIFEILRPNKITKTIEIDKVVTSFTIGYKKFIDNEEINSIDNIFTERTFTSSLKNISNEKKQLCEFVADNYAIELTRREQEKKTTEGWRFDENTFVIGVSYFSDEHGIFYTRDTEYSEGFFLGEELINAKISPMRNALRWADYLFFVNGATNLKFTTGKVNCEALTLTRTKSQANGEQIEYSFLCLEDSYGAEHYENETIGTKPRKMIAEVWQIDGYPMTLEQYKHVAENPMGLVLVDGHPCWIKEFSYSFADGTADFKLTPKHIEQ